MTSLEVPRLSPTVEGVSDRDEPLGGHGYGEGKATLRQPKEWISQ